MDINHFSWSAPYLFNLRIIKTITVTLEFLITLTQPLMYMYMVNILIFQTLFVFCSQRKCGISGLEFTNILVRIANGGDLDQTVSSEALWSWSTLFYNLGRFLAGKYCSKF